MQASVIHHSPAGDGEKSRRGGFTLIEIMVVVAIIAVLAGILLAVGSAVLRSASNNATKNTLTALDNAMTLWLKDHPEPGTAPPCPNSIVWVQALSSSPDTAKLLEKLKSRGTGASREILDGYGGAIVYVPSNLNMATSVPNTPVFANLHTPGRFVSFGADGKPDTVALGALANASSGDDIYSAGVGQ